MKFVIFWFKSHWIFIRMFQSIKCIKDLGSSYHLDRWWPTWLQWVNYFFVYTCNDFLSPHFNHIQNIQMKYFPILKLIESHDSASMTPKHIHWHQTITARALGRSQLIVGSFWLPMYPSVAWSDEPKYLPDLCLKEGYFKTPCLTCNFIWPHNS